MLLLMLVVGAAFNSYVGNVAGIVGVASAADDSAATIADVAFVAYVALVSDVASLSFLLQVLVSLFFWDVALTISYRLMGLVLLHHLISITWCCFGC